MNRANNNSLQDKSFISPPHFFPVKHTFTFISLLPNSWTFMGTFRADCSLAQLFASELCISHSRVHFHFLKKKSSQTSDAVESSKEFAWLSTIYGRVDKKNRSLQNGVSWKIACADLDTYHRLLFKTSFSFTFRIKTKCAENYFLIFNSHKMHHTPSVVTCANSLTFYRHQMQNKSCRKKIFSVGPHLCYGNHYHKVHKDQTTDTITTLKPCTYVHACTYCMLMLQTEIVLIKYCNRWITLNVSVLW